MLAAFRRARDQPARRAAERERLADQRYVELAQLAADLKGADGVAVETHGFDLSKHENIKALADVAGHCDILVNNAGALPRGSLYEVTPEAWRHGWDLKVFGYIDLTRCILPRMTERKSGVIINIIGMAGERPEPKYIATCCGNAALMMFTQCIGAKACATACAWWA